MTADDAPNGRCITCDAPLLQRRGFYATDLCGPCCTGESADLGCVSWECERVNTPPSYCDGGWSGPLGKQAPKCCRCGASMRVTQRPPKEVR